MLVGLPLVSSCDSSPREAGPEPAAPRSVALIDLEGETIHPLRDPSSSHVLFLFTREDCPISNRYAPEVIRLHERFAGEGLEFVLVYPDAAQSPEGIREHQSEYGYTFSALRDPRHELVRLAGATVTPEAALFDSSGTLLYRGRIDDRVTDFGKARLEANVRDLENALAAIEANCEGVLRTGPTGDGGFGYDPIFVPVEHRDDMSQSFAVLGADVKDRLSHRGKALRELVSQLPALLAAR